MAGIALAPLTGMPRAGYVPTMSIHFESATLPRVVYAGLARDPAGTAFSEHTLELLEINYLSGGSCDMILNGEHSRVESGSAYVYRPGDVAQASVSAHSGPLVCRWVKFTWPDFADGKSSRFDLPRAIALSPESQRAVQRHFDALLDAHAGGLPGWEVLASGNLTALIGVLLREASRAGRSSGNPALDRRLAAACMFMEQNFARRLKMSDVAKSAQLAEDYFSRVFRKRLGVSPLQYLIGARIQEGRRLLAQSPGITIRQASRLSGFDDARHFARSFRKQFGVTPDQFRRELASPFRAAK